MTHILTLDTLKAKGACTVALKKFAKIFPNGALVAVETFVNVAGDFNWWCAMKLLLKADIYEDKGESLHTKHYAEWVTLFAKHDAERATLFANLYIQQLAKSETPS